jgi:hypothetical protein
MKWKKQGVKGLRQQTQLPVSEPLFPAEGFSARTAGDAYWKLTFFLKAFHNGPT